MGAKHAKVSAIVRINDKLKTVIRKGENGFCSYIDRNITDATVAKELGVLPASVAHVRKDMFGNLVASPNGSSRHTVAELASKLEQLAARVAVLERDDHDPDLDAFRR